MCRHLYSAVWRHENMSRSCRPADALSGFGGGIRGLFRVDRTYRPRAALTAGPARTGGAAARWGVSAGGGGGPGEGSNSADSSWTAIATSAPRQLAQAAAPQQEEAAGQGGLGGRWVVIGKKKAQLPQQTVGRASAPEGATHNSSSSSSTSSSHGSS